MSVKHITNKFEQVTRNAENSVNDSREARHSLNGDKDKRNSLPGLRDARNSQNGTSGNDKQFSQKPKSAAFELFESQGIVIAPVRISSVKGIVYPVLI